ncbi:MAG TPA: ABC-F family ATP-binding cassette domain-containing protein [Trueperaceae bacterium]
MPELLLQAHGLAYQIPGQPQPLFENASLALHQSEKVALVGRNGAGKTTLLEVLLGKRQPTAGQLTHRPSDLAYLPQDEPWDDAGTVRQSLLEPWPDLARLHAGMMRMEAAGLPDPLQYAERVAAFHAQGGYEQLAQAEKTLAAFGLAATLERPLAALSGGERRLLRLASVTAAAAGLTLLDEPTNYLDAVATERLIAAICASDRAFVIVSHDRWFLDQTVGRILELERGGLESYHGTYSTFSATKAAIRRHKQRQKDKLETEIGKLQEMERSYKVWGARKEAEKSGAADKGFVGARAARLAKRGILAKERLRHRADELRDTRPWVERDYEIAFEPVTTPNGTCLAVRGLHYAPDAQPLLTDLSFQLDWGEKIAITGPNAAGKSTLLRLLLGELAPDAGQILRSKGIRLGMLPQQWNPALDARTPASLYPREQHPRAQTLLGCLRVPGDTLQQPLRQLSEGQKRKTLLVQLILAAPNLLILDEPTTHLDYRSVEMLEQALTRYQGTLLLVSHDRYLRERVTRRKIELAPGRD